MKRDCYRRRKARGGDVARSIAADERNATFFYEVRYVGVIAGKSGGVRPSAQRGAPLPTARVKKNNVARRHLHVLQLFQGLEVFPMDGRSGFEPPLRGGLAWQPRPIEEDGSGDHAIFQSVDIPLRATARGDDVFHRPAVVALTFRHDVTIHRVQMTVNHAMIRAGVLVAISRAGGTNSAENTLQNVRRIRSFLLDDIVRQ